MGGGQIFTEKSCQLILSDSIVFTMCIFLLLAHFINIHSFHANLISDLNVQGGRGQ